MRVAILVAGLLVLSLLAGCAQTQDGPADTGPTDHRDARPGRGGRVDEERRAELQEVEVLRRPLVEVGQGPVRFDVDIPGAVEGIVFYFRAATTYQAVGIRVDLTGCGAYDNAGGYAGSTDYFAGDLCGRAEPGRQQVTITATALVFQGDFVLTAFVPQNSTASA